MSFTKVAPAGIGTSPGTSIRLGDSLLHSTGLDIGVGSGIGVTIRQHGDATFTGIITASAFFGDGSGLEGVSSSGIGTPLSDDDTSELNKIYYVNQELSIGSTVTVNHPSSAVASYTHYQDLVVKDDADFIVSDGDTFIPDVLGIRTSTSTASAAIGGRIRAGTITNAGANGAPNFPNGLTGTAGTFTGNLNVGGVLTYEDVTNVDSVGLITARSGIKIGPTAGVAGTFFADGSYVTTGIITASSFVGDGSNLTGLSGLSVANQSDNRLITCTGTTDSLNGEANLSYSSNSSLNLTDTQGTSNLGGNYLLLKRTTANANYINAPLANADLIISADENLLFHTVHTADFNSTERLRITSQGTAFVKSDGTAPVNQAEAGHYSGTGYNAGNALGLMVKRAIHVSDADTKGVGGMFLSHTRNVACNGTTYNMFTLHNREGTFIGDIYVGFSGNSSGAVRQYRFTCLYNTNTLTSVQFNRRSNNDNLTVNISSSNTAHFFQVIPTKSGGGTERVSMTIVGACCGRNDGAGGDFYTVSYNS
jgi:hypothetical protein